MINLGRPPKGYSDYENIFYLLKKQLELEYEILEQEIMEINQKYRENSLDYLKQEKEYYQLTETLKVKYLQENENPEVADSMAINEALTKLGMDLDLFYNQMENQRIIKKQIIDNKIKASIIIMYSMIEYNISKVANIYTKKKDPTTLKTNYLDTSLKMIGITYEPINKFKCIRNKIVHENSSYRLKKVQAILKTYEGCFDVEEDNRFVFTRLDFIKDFHKESLVFLGVIKDSIDLNFNKYE